MAMINFIRGTWDKFSALTSYQANAIYFIYDKGRIYQADTTGATAYEVAGNNFELVDALPEVTNAFEGRIYVLKSEGTAYTKINNALVQIGGGEASEIANGIVTFDKFAEGTVVTTISETESAGDSSTIPTVKAVRDAISSSLVDYDVAIVDVSAARAEDNSGTVLTFTTKEGTTKPVTISDLFLTAASYDTNTHTLSLTVRGQDTPVEVDLAQLVPQAVSTNDVALAESITVTTPVGNFTMGQVIDINDITNVQEFLVKMLSKDSNPTVTQPSSSITLTGAGAKEVGTSFTPNYTANLNPGSYSANKNGAQPTGVTATSWSVTDTNGGTSTTKTGTFSAFTVQDNTNYKVSVTVCHTAGNTPTTYLGDPYEAGKIAEDNTGKSATSSAVTGYRQGFYGSLTSKSAAVDSTLVRGLPDKFNKKAAKGQKYTVNVPSGTLRVVLAYESSVGSVASITSAEQFGSEIKDSFVLQKVSVNDASGANPKEYNVYVKDMATAQANTTTYTVTL